MMDTVGQGVQEAASRNASRMLVPFVLTVDAAAILAVAFLPAGLLVERTGTLLLLGGLAALAGARPVSISALRTEVIATHPFVFCALAVVGPRAAGLVALAGVLGATAENGPRRQPLRLVFNVGAVLLSTALASWAFLVAGGSSGAHALSLVGPLAAATGVYFAVNTGLVAMAIALEKGQRFISTWKQSVQWTTVGFFTGLTLAVGLVLLLETLGAWGLALGIPPCWLLAAFYRAYKERLEEHQRRLEIMEGVNEELERRVDERTRELQEALDRIEELQTLKHTLTQSLVHDLKNPLTAVVGNLDLLERQAEDRTLTLVRRSKSGASRLLRMILDLLDISRLEDGRFVLQPGTVDAAALVQRAVKDSQTTAAAQEVRFIVESPGGPCPVHGDASMLRRVVDNLISNALQHSPSGSTVRLEVAEHPEGVEISVIDEGPGIPEEYRDKIFEKYARLDLREAGLTTNRGLGLTFCRLAVEAHGGTIRAEEAPGGGALFRTRLPASEETGEPETAPPALSA